MFDRDDFYEKVALAIEPTGKVSVTGDTRFKEVPEWDSITSVSIVAMVFVEFDVQIGGDDIVNVVTLDDLAEIIDSKMAAHVAS